MENNYIVIMAGGSGTRLWPVSRANLPKQFHKFGSNEKSLIQETYERVKGLVPKKNIYISLVENIYQTTRKQLPEVPVNNFIIEPEGKNTAPAIGLISILINTLNPEAIIATIASDHTVGKVEEFRRIIKKGLNFIKRQPTYIITVGIEPTEPNTGYGYIKKGRKLARQEIFEVEKFVEKPDSETAKKYMSSGEYLWNASYFIFSAEQMFDSFRQLAPEIHQRLKRISQAINTHEFKQILKEEYSQFLKEPIDTVIAEKHPKMAIIPADIGWSDVGNWGSLYEILSKNTGQNNISRGHHIGVEDKNCLIYAQDKLLATVGLEDIIIVDTPDVTLVCHKNKSQDIKNLIEKLKKNGKSRYL